MKNMLRAATVAIAGIMAGAVVAPVAAAPLSFLNGTILLRIPTQDGPAFRTAVAQVLNTAPDGSTTEWTSAHSRGRSQVKVVFTPQETVQTASSRTCRLLAAQVAQQAETENWKFWFCQQPDGTWKSSAH